MARHRIFPLFKTNPLPPTPENSMFLPPPIFWDGEGQIFGREAKKSPTKIPKNRIKLDLD